MRVARAFLLVIVLAVSAEASNSDSALPKLNDRWIEVRSANFLFFSDAGISATKQVAVDLEELRAVLAELGRADLDAPLPTYIYVFRNDRSFAPFKPLDRGDQASISGSFWGQDSANYIAINADSPDASGVVFHEYVHDVTAINMRWLPLWFSEGIAEFYQTFEVVDETAYIGLPIRSHMQRIGVGTLVPFSTLVPVDTDSPYYNETGLKRAFYAQSWALTHYLLLGNAERRQQLDHYLFLVKNGAFGMDAFTNAFGNDIASLEMEVVRHFRKPRVQFIKEKTEAEFDKRLTIRKMPVADVLYRLGDLLANQTFPRPDADTFFEAALEVDPEHSRALMAVALRAEEQEDWAKASDFYQRALAARPEDPDILFRWGEYLSLRGNDMKQALTAFRKSTELNPNFAPGWRALAVAYATAGARSPEALFATENAHRLLPTDREITEILLRLYLYRDDRERAVSLVEETQAENPVAIAQAWTTILSNDLQLTREYLLQDRLEAARARIRLAEPSIDRSSNPEFLHDGFATARQIVSEHTGARLYDQATALLEGGDPKAARKLLEQALSELDDSAVARSCRHLIDVIDHPEKYAVKDSPAIELSPTTAEIAHLNQLLAARDLEAAHAYLEDLRGRSAGLQEQWLENKIREIEKTLQHNHFVDGYNSAVDCYNDGDYQGAIEILETLLTVLGPGYQADSTRALLTDARTAMGED